MSSVRTRRDRIVVTVAEWESALLVSFVDSARTVLESPDRDDPVVRRLLPDAYPDRAAAQEFRDLTGGELQRAKADALGGVKAALQSCADGRVELTVDEAATWLQALTDIRLVIGGRLGVTEDWVAQAQRLEPRDPRLELYAAYDWVSVLQEQLVEQVSRAAGLDP